MTQFHDVKELSTTLDQAAKNKIITASECLHLFVQICSTLKHLHLRGFPHNDTKSNNVVLDRGTRPGKFNPSLIDFGKGAKASASMSVSFNKNRPHGNTYLAPDVLENRKYSSASESDFNNYRILRQSACCC